MLTIIPAIDLKDGRCVRLTQGRAQEARVYSDDPVEVARHWEKQGAGWLHVVDLDGAFQGRPVHTAAIAGIVSAVGMNVEVGGGLRSDQDIERALACGVARAIVGTRALAGPEALAALARRFGPRVAVGIDARNGWVQVQGWAETTSFAALELADAVVAAGIETIIYTDTATDGMLRGPNVGAMAEMCGRVSCTVIASGGVTTPADVAALAGLGCGNLAGAIVGKALYEGRATYAQLCEAALTVSRQSEKGSV